MVGRSFLFPSWTVLIVIGRPSCRRGLEPRGQGTRSTHPGSSTHPMTKTKGKFNYLSAIVYPTLTVYLS